MNGGDWGGACVNLVRALEAHEMIFGDRDSRTVEVAQMLQVGRHRCRWIYDRAYERSARIFAKCVNKSRPPVSWQELVM